MISTLKRVSMRAQGAVQNFLNRVPSIIQAAGGPLSMRPCQALSKKLRIIVMGCVVLKLHVVSVMGIWGMFSMMVQNQPV